MVHPALPTTLLVLLGVALVAALLAAPAEEPPDRIEYAVEPTDGEIQHWETLRYEGLSARGQTMFDAARSSETGYHTVTTDELDAVPPLADGSVAVYDVQYDGQWYLLQVKYFRTEVPGEEHAFRLGSLALGTVLAMAGGYRAVTA